MNKKLIIAVIILIISVTIFLIWHSQRTFEIPQNYIKKFENHKSYIDGPDIDYYVYDDRIIMEEKNYFPVGSKYTYTHEITMYNNIDNTNDINTLIQIQNILKYKDGKIVLKENNK